MTHSDHSKTPIGRRPAAPGAPRTEAPRATLDDSVAAETAALLLEAAEARALAALLGSTADADQLRAYAAALEDSAGKWEQRMAWWKRLRKRESV